ncbi:16S rRNA (guanine(527)-N(7))-methyltransferase RsmG [Rhodobacterales bacterium HKCCE2091]|nr:16S rRNA (guanine(527)-N(7))-methyltransferase RsmG [Rhodobacterales bacterium HKCCE2091]
MTEDEARAYVAANVSRETLTKLEIYAVQLAKWQPAINLVAPSTLAEAWSRHIADSFQVFPLRHVDSGLWLDIGSGAGFPGLVCAMAAAELAPGLRFTFIESDLRKCGFIRETARLAGLEVGILTRRIEDAPPQNADIVSARALAPLPRLLGLVDRHLSDGGIALLPKGKSHRAEEIDADAIWQMKRESFASKTDPEAVIYRIGDLARV